MRRLDQLLRVVGCLLSATAIAQTLHPQWEVNGNPVKPTPGDVGTGVPLADG